MAFVLFESVYAVFDPMGGLAAGERVTRAARDAFRFGVALHGDVPRALRDANDAVREAVHGNVTLRGAGCSAAAVTLSPAIATVAWAGDVHLLLLRGGSLRAITREHTMLNDGAARVCMSSLSPSKRKELGSVVVRALGMTRELDVELRTISVEQGDVFALLCDGLLDALGERLVHSLLHEHRNDLDAGVRALIDAGSSGTVAALPELA